MMKENVSHSEHLVLNKLVLTTDMQFEWLVFAEDWGRHPSSSQHIFRSLIDSHDVVYWVNSIGLRRPRIKDYKRVIEKIKQFYLPKSNNFNQHELNPSALSPQDVIAPIALSWPGSSLVSQLNRYLLTKQIRHKLPLDMSSKTKCRVLWLSLPTAHCVINDFAEDCVVYYAGDDFSALAGVDHNGVTQEERELVKQADIIIAASDVIAAKFPQHKTHVINHGVDSQLFSQCKQKPDDFPSGEFTVGYYGSISEWLDYDLIEFIARNRPDVNFVFIGRIISQRSDSIFQLANVFHFADMPHQKLIEYASNWQVSWMPFLLNAQILACDPLKLREYLAIAKPILSTSFPALKPFEHVVFHHDNKTSMLNTLQTILSLVPAQLDELAVNSKRCIEVSNWDHRAEQIKSLVTLFINKKMEGKYVNQ